MYRNLSLILLCGLLIWYAAAQIREPGKEEVQYGIRVNEQKDDGKKSGEHVDGRICMTAALRELQESKQVVVRFVLEGNGHVHRSSVLLTPNSRNENGLYTASAIYEDLLSGTYTLYVESASGANLDYILAEDGSESKYEIRDNTISFEISENARTGSAWFMMQEGEGEAL